MEFIGSGLMSSVDSSLLEVKKEIVEFSQVVEKMFNHLEVVVTEKESKLKIEEEISDILFVLTCLSNQMNIDLERIMIDNLQKKTNRDHMRHKLNKKLK